MFKKKRAWRWPTFELIFFQKQNGLGCDRNSNLNVQKNDLACMWPKFEFKFSKKQQSGVEVTDIRIYVWAWRWPNFEFKFSKITNRAWMWPKFEFKISNTKQTSGLEVTQIQVCFFFLFLRAWRWAKFEFNFQTKQIKNRAWRWPNFEFK